MNKTLFELIINSKTIASVDINKSHNKMHWTDTRQVLRHFKRMLDKEYSFEESHTKGYGD